MSLPYDPTRSRGTNDLGRAEIEADRARRNRVRRVVVDGPTCATVHYAVDGTDRQFNTEREALAYIIWG